MDQAASFWNFFAYNGQSIVSIVLATSIPLVIWLGLRNRQDGDRTRGIGWQFIRFLVLTIALPVVAILTLNERMTGEAATLIGSVMGYAFGKSEGGSDRTN